MYSFLYEAVQLLYYAYFKPSALQNRLNQAALREETDTSFLLLSSKIWTTAGARRLLLQCTLWWLAGLIPFWWLATKMIPWPGILVIGIGLVLASWATSLSNLPLGLTLPWLLGLVWGLEGDSWSTAQTSLGAYEAWRIWGLIAGIVIVGASLGGECMRLARSEKRRELRWLAVWIALGAFLLAAFVMIFLEAETAITLITATSVAAIIAFSIVLSGMSFGTNDAVGGVAAGVIAGAAVGVIFIVAASISVKVTVNIAFIVAVCIAVGTVVGVMVGLTGIVAGTAKGAMEGIVAGVMTGVVAIIMAIIVAGSVLFAVASAPLLPTSTALSYAFAVGLALSCSRRRLWIDLLAVAVYAALFVESQGWQYAVWVLFYCLLGYFRLLMCLWSLIWILRTKFIINVGDSISESLLHRLPPFSDGYIRFRVYVLDQVLVTLLEENSKLGQQAVKKVADSYYQNWAAYSAIAQRAEKAMSNCHSLKTISASQKEFSWWLPDESAKPQDDVTKVLRHTKIIARQVDEALSATSNYNRLRRLNQAQVSANELQRSFPRLKGQAVRRFLPAAQHWEKLISDEIDRLSAEQEIQADIPNPYITGIPVQPDEAAIFAPRPDLMRAVENALTAAHGKPTLALYGPRRMGKTTFLLHLPRLLPDEVLPVFVDLQEAAQVSGLAGLYYNWAAAAVQAAREQQRLDLPRPSLDTFRTEPAIAWREWLDAAERALGGRTLFFTFDEFEWLVDAAQRDPALEGAFSILRHLSQHRPRVYLLFAGAHRLEELAPGGRWHDYFINVRPLEVSCLDEDQARRLLTNPIPDFPLDCAPGVVDQIVRLTRCQPMLVQLTGSLLVDWLNSPERRQQGDWLIATMQDVEHAAGEILHTGRPYFANLWHDAGEQGRQVLLIVAQQAEGCPWEALQVQSGLQEGELSETLSRLAQYQLVEEVDGRWRVQVELTRRAFVGLAGNDRA